MNYNTNEFDAKEGEKFHFSTRVVFLRKYIKFVGRGSNMLVHIYNIDSPPSDNGNPVHWIPPAILFVLQDRYFILCNILSFFKKSRRGIIFQKKKNREIERFKNFF